MKRRLQTIYTQALRAAFAFLWLFVMSSCGTGEELTPDSPPPEQRETQNGLTMPDATPASSLVFSPTPAPTLEPTPEPTMALSQRTEFGRLPAIVLNTYNGEDVTSKTDYVNGTLAVEVGDGALYDPSYSLSATDMQMKGRGQSSWNWPKKPYRVRTYSDTSLFGLPQAKNWILRPSYTDKSLIRDHVASVMGNTLQYMDFVPRTVLVDVYLNSAYQGVYILSEYIEIKTGRLHLDESTEEDTGYLMEIGGCEDSDILGVHYFNTNSFAGAYVKEPDVTIRRAEQMQFITDYVQAADAAVTKLEGYEDYIDIPSLIDWFILHELTYNLDSSFRRSCFMTKDAGGKLKMGPPWDFDLAFGNHYRYSNTPNVWASVKREDGYVGVTWMDYLLTDPAFTAQLKTRWEEVGDGLLATALEEIDTCEKVIRESQQENFQRWRIMGIKAGFEPANIVKLDTYEEHLQQMRDFLHKRKAWIDKAIDAF